MAFPGQKGTEGLKGTRVSTGNAGNGVKRVTRGNPVQRVLRVWMPRVPSVPMDFPWRVVGGEKPKCPGNPNRVRDLPGLPGLEGTAFPDRPARDLEKMAKMKQIRRFTGQLPRIPAMEVWIQTETTFQATRKLYCFLTKCMMARLKKNKGIQ